MVFNTTITPKAIREVIFVPGDYENNRITVTQNSWQFKRERQTISFRITNNFPLARNHAHAVFLEQIELLQYERLSEH
jgi:hypothetical protein